MIVLVACWLLVSPFVLSVRGAGRWVIFVTGAVVLLMTATFGILTRRRLLLGRALMTAGVWLIVASLTIPMREALAWSGIVAGAFVGSLALAGQTQPPARDVTGRSSYTSR